MKDFRKNKKYRKAMALVLMLVMVAGLAGCSEKKEEKIAAPISLVKDDTKKENEKENDIQGGKDETDVPTAEMDSTVLQSGMNAFAYEIAEQLNQNGNDANYFFSPYSLCAALTLLGNASQGDTLAQINEVLGINDLEDWNKQLSLFMKKEQPGDAYLISANSLWLAKGYEPSETFYSEYYPLVSKYFEAGLFEADYKDNPKQTVKQMNQWISEATEGMIPDFVKDVDKDTVITLMNAVYFYGEWLHTFEASSTRERTFYGTNGETEVQMMGQGDLYLSYYEKDGVRGICMPYGDGSKVMNILIADDNSDKTAAELFEDFTSAGKNEFLGMLMNADTIKVETLRIPKFSMEYTMNDVPEILKKMGMTDVFDPIKAELNHINAETYVSDVSHMAKIEVDELGSKAAAVTIVEGVDGCAPEEEEIKINFVVDRPFIFFIQDVESEIILFSGQVSNL